ncbi:carboxypeptidase-like regulatory domain-containing protein, partial [Kaarinaea lacus]
GSLQGSRRAKEYNLRASLGYLLKPDRELDSVSITADGFKLWGFNASAGISKVISADNEQFTFGLNRQLNGYSLGVSTRVTSDGIYSLDLLFNTSLAREPRTGKWFREARPIASQGAISAQVFLDENGDGKKDAEEDVLPGVKININGGATKNRTDEDGISFHTGLLTYQEMDVDIALDSLEDPLLQPSNSGLRVDLRPGHVTQLDFPVMQTGEVDGTTFVQYGDVVREASGVHIELIDSDGKVVKSVRSAYDGFFVIDRIPVGFYKLRVSEQQIKDLGLLPVEERIIEITSKTPIINGQDFLLKKGE